jgi:hypothetical protein
MHGSGLSMKLDGSLYSGQFRLGVKTGVGTQHYSNGSIYTG